MSDGIPHGTLYGYNGKWRCRCEACRDAYRTYRRANAERIKARMAQYYIDNRDHILQRNLAYYQANRDKEIARATERNKANREACREATRRWRRRNPDYSWRANNRERDRENARRYSRTPKAKQYQKTWRQTNSDRVAAASARWARKNPTKVHANNTRTRIRRRSVEMFRVTKRDWLRLCRRFDNRCAYCREAKPLTQDHVVPLSRGGRHSIGNLLPACLSCNSSKNARLLVEWRRAKAA